MRKIFFLIAFVLGGAAALSAHEFRYEIGAMAGLGFYVGDIGNRPGGAYGFVFRQNLNYRWALKYDLSLARMKGTTEGWKNVLPEETQYRFSRRVLEATAEAEFNFFHYGIGDGYKDTRRISPYIVAGVGFSAVPQKGDGSFALQIPMGVGLKYKVARRWNMGLEFTMHKTLGDKLDGKALKDPYGITGSALKNTDWYGMVLFSITYDFGRKCANCNPSSR